ADMLSSMTTIHGIALYLGVVRELLYHRIHTGALCKPDVVRKPPYGNYLIRDDAALLARLRAEVTRSHRRRGDASTGSLPPARGASLSHPHEGTSRAAHRARTSRTNRSTRNARVDT